MARWHCRLLAAWWLALPLVAGSGLGQEMPAPDPMLSDAQLTDVVFVDRAQGWAVGDRGVIWHTADAGRTWTLQPSGVDCRLSSVCFVSDKIGWAAGGYMQPYTHATVGVVLTTRDGGAHWTPARARVLPAIRRIGFFDAAQGWAVGQTSAYFPTGVYTTSDGGKSWSAVPGDAGGDWLTGDFVDPNTGALAGRTSASATVRRRGVEPQAADFGLRALARMKLTAPAGGWLVGDGGLVLATRDLGKTWQTTAGALPPGCARHFDFEALSVVGRQVWVAGTPGTRVLHSGDAGQTWQAADTGQPLPIRSLAFVDEKNGWAGGDLGTILATTDGGRTWKTQRAGAQRAALAGFFSRPDEIPLELVARLSADEGYVGTIEILNRELAELRAAVDPASLVHEASVRAGASVGEAAWRFPLRSASLKLSADRLVDDWNRANDGEALEKLSAHVVGRIRMWRPSVVVTVGAEARDPLTLAVNQIVLSAVEHAADATRHPEQIAEAGLQPWKVQKVYATLREGSGTTNINTAQVTTRLGRSIGELAAPARGLVARQYVPPPANVGFRLLVDHIPQEVGQRDFFSGIGLSPGGEARRAYEPNSRNNLDAARREAQRFRNLQAILAQADNHERDGRFLASIADQTRDMEPARAAEVLFQLAERYWIRGRWDLAAECYEVIAERHADHPLAGASLVWLVQFYASGEAALRGGPGGAITAANRPGEVRQAGGVSAAADVAQAGGPVVASHAAGDRAAKAAGYAEQLEQVEPALAYEPRVRFPVAVAQRRQGSSGTAERFFQALVRNRPRDAWWACAKTELWLVDRQDQPPKPLWNCRRAPAKPRLDGRLDEPLWQAAQVVELRSPQREDADWGAVVMLSYDDEFLYVGASCSRAPGFHYDAAGGPRPRDPDLSDHDRLELVLDVDRDFATYYRLAIDHRGWVSESCWHDATWNPAWFVAAGGDEKAWTAEAAIPLAELVGASPAPGTSWALGAQRTVPGVGFQSWTEPAAPEVMPEGLGYLIFHAPAAVAQ
jgi:photosystem II stability/assembly factor-like uncharacterized protein